ncbi:MAG: 5,10-methylenetetrahydromethanopterin reductase [Methanocella sp. PtaU1.Bin125]|nr:MAG: 5,10-methylenetetrahydromethanopterin reductase [Methanocella sp. PtaU1.Bin125]
MVKLGLKLGPEEYPPVDLLEYAVIAEDAGFEAIDVSDHFHPWAEAGNACYIWTWLGAAASRTSHVLIGPGVTCPILRYHPSIIAQAAATLDNFAPGRTYLGVGTGKALNEYAATGVWPDYNERQQMLLEAITLIRELWEGGYVTFDGAWYTTRKAKLYTPPKSRIPIIVSSLVPESAAFAGTYGDGLFTLSGKPMETMRQIIDNFEHGANEANKDPIDMPRYVELNVAYTKDTKSAIGDFKKYWAGAYVPALFNEKIYTPARSEQNGAMVGDDTIMQMACISDDPEEHAAFAQQYIDAGFTHLFFHAAGPEQARFIRDYAKDVLPIVRQRNTRVCTPVR